MSERNASHTKSQRLARKRDRGVCQICGSTLHPEAHHTVDFQFDGSSGMSNLVTVCRKHHKSIHRGDIDIWVV